MYVYGIPITDEQIEACLAKMRAAPMFATSTIEAEAVRAGIPERIGASWQSIYPANRLADRLVQRERKAGNIERCSNGMRHGSWWRWRSSDQP